MAYPAHNVSADDFPVELLRRAQAGQESARRDLVERFSSPVFGVLSRMLGVRAGGSRRQALVEDLAQETFLRVFRQLSSFDPDGRARLSTWVLTIAVRLGIDELRRRRRPEPEPLDAAAHVASGGDPDREARRRALARAIERAVAALSPEQRAVFVLREHHGFSYEELASALAIDVGTVRSRLFRARTALREELSAQEAEL